ncbi:family 20 glycosylhydrolase [Actinokineospora fastidiosa]|uniref:beta-N-acetylhexosaminidase n=1 Tax=Actinokineospora fastidiosa TaxID=1816 RepID=A0A918LIY7_9PSEU|nr:family 20 glycosylhydrolase [Actinokineospora fastidiosa]GGS54539.1 beta-N-acetylhexosaminidase [Actinokineospora fastidiosa]
MTTNLPLVPLPTRAATTRPGRVRLGTPDAVAVAVPPGLARGVTDWFATWAERLHGLGVRMTPPGESRAGITVVVDDPDALGLTRLPGPDGVDPRAAQADERYRLTVRPDSVLVEAAGDEAAFRGLTTLLQLVDPAGTVPGVAIEDGPAYAWRGLSLDVARHYFPPEEICSVIDLLAWHKLNVLHLHLTDSQAWRVEIARRPGLTGSRPGATADFYSRADLDRIIAYAAERYVTVVPEFDMPGHVVAAFTAYPELAGGAEPVHPHVRYLDPDVPEAAAFAHDVLHELVDLAPGPFVHLGADEPFGMPAAAYLRFVRDAHALLRSRGKRVVAWQEAVRAGCLDGDDVVQYWIGPDNPFDVGQLKARAPAALHPVIDDAARLFALAPQDVPTAAAAGVPVLVSSNTMLYLDCPYADTADEESGRRQRRVGHGDYLPHSPEQAFAWHPSTLPELTSPAARIAGVEAAIWCETVDSFDDLAFLLLPRLAGAAEKAWTRQVTDWPDHHSRLAAHADAWSAMGFRAAYRPMRTRPR